MISSCSSYHIEDYDHEEADTRLENGPGTCIIRTVDTDVVILIGKFSSFLSLNSSADIWVAFGTGKNFTNYHINVICQS